jgi:hypothetical protein
MQAMKMYLCLLFFLILSFFSYSQQKKIMFFDQNWQSSISQYHQYYQCECFVLASGAFDGPFSCYKNGTDTLVKLYHFQNNTLHGEIFEYFDNGNQKLVALYDNGKPINEWKEWNEKGELIVNKNFDEQGKLIKDNFSKDPSDYEKMYFGNKPFEEPVFCTKCILLRNETEKYKCSQTELLNYYKTPPLPPSYFLDIKFAGKQFVVKLKYQLSEKGKVLEVKIVETSGDAFLDELAEYMY